MGQLNKNQMLECAVYKCNGYKTKTAMRLYFYLINYTAMKQHTELFIAGT